MNKICKEVSVYTDGSCSKNPGPGGWACVFKFNHGIIKEISGYENFTTNNVMELTAAIKGLQFLDDSYNITLYTDSMYLRNGITNWRYKWEKNNWITANKKPVKNIDLWKELIKSEQKHSVHWVWVKAHLNNYYNNMVDSLAVKETQKLKDIINQN